MQTITTLWFTFVNRVKKKYFSWHRNYGIPRKSHVTQNTFPRNVLLIKFENNSNNFLRQNYSPIRNDIASGFNPFHKRKLRTVVLLADISTHETCLQEFIVILKHSRHVSWVIHIRDVKVIVYIYLCPFDTRLFRYKCCAELMTLLSKRQQQWSVSMWYVVL